MADSFTYFRGYVPSDVAAGIALMAMEQKAEHSVEDPLHKDLHSPLDFHSTSVCAQYNRVVYYVRYATAAYGWKIDYHNNALRGIATSLGRMCGVGKKKGETVLKARGDPLGWNLDNLKRLTRVTDTDIVFVSFASEVFCPAFYVVVDHSQKTVVVVIRGTFSIKDALTDLSAQPSLLAISE
ncbi:Diacylglycerol lipase-beta, partial [Geodia barretti]